MENMLYNELLHRGYNVDVGVVEVDQMLDGKRKRCQYEIDFVVNIGSEKVYISAFLLLCIQEVPCHIFLCDVPKAYHTCVQFA